MMRFVQQMNRHRPQIVFVTAAGERVKAVTDTARIEHKDRPETCAITGGQVKEFAFDVVDDRGIRPGQELRDREQAFAAAGWGYDQQIAELAAGWCRADGEHPAIGPDP